MLDTIYLNQQRQAWFEDYLAKIGAEPLAFVGAARGAPVEAAAEVITDALDYGLDRRATFRTTDDARKYLIRSFERLGGLVVVSSTVGNNTHRMLDRDEFRGFTLRSATAPLVFVNANDTKAGQVFSLLHEFAHVWHGDTGVSVGGDPLTTADAGIERWCDQVAAEIAVPARDLVGRFNADTNLTVELARLAMFYRCSSLVVLIRLRDVGRIPGTGFRELYEAELGRLLSLITDRENVSGGDFYNNQPFRIGERLSRALVADTRSGATSMTEALRLMAFSSTKVFDSYASKLQSA
jgi:Zn-dependent peptidase ImmA (M78 family)